MTQQADNEIGFSRFSAGRCEKHNNHTPHFRVRLLVQELFTTVVLHRNRCASENLNAFANRTESSRLE
jgi:hypothetical protein